MVESEQGLVALAILVFAVLLATIAAVVVLVRSGRLPGLGATSGRAVEVVAARLAAIRLEAESDPAGVLERPAHA